MFWDHEELLGLNQMIAKNLIGECVWNALGQSLRYSIFSTEDKDDSQKKTYM